MIDVELIKILQSKIEELQLENKKMKDKIEQLKNLLNNLKTRFSITNNWGNYFLDTIDDVLEE